MDLSDQINKKIRKHANIVYDNIENLIFHFKTIMYGKNNKIKNTEFDDMYEKLQNALEIVGKLIITECTHEYIIKFHEDISNDNVNKIYNFNYEELIVSNTMDSTRKLITQLIKSMKKSWDKANSEQKTQIKIYILLLDKHCILFDKYNKMLKNF